MLHSGSLLAELDDSNKYAPIATNVESPPKSNFLEVGRDGSTGARETDFGLGGSVMMGATDILF